jgi:magnesium transporter
MRTIVEELITRLLALLESEEAHTLIPQLLEEVQPFDLAEALSELSEAQARLVLTLLPPQDAAAVLEHMEYLEQYRLLHHMEEARARAILDQMSSAFVADLVMAIHPRQAERMLTLLHPDYVSEIRQLMQYPENTAGGRMTIDYISVRQQMTVERVLAHIRKVGREADTISYIYVVDSAGRLVGVVSLRELIMADPRQRVSEIMTEHVISVPADMDQEEVARVVSQYDFVAVPVVDQGGRLLGIVTVDDVIDVIQEEATEDVLRLGATAAVEERPGQTLLQTVWGLAKPRLPWLVSLLFLELGSSFIVDTFSNFVTPTLAAMLAMFTVVMAGESGNAATQALAVVVRGLATGEIEESEMPRVVLREALVGVVVGAIAGGTLLLTGWLWQGNFMFGLAAGLALAANLFIAKVLGGLFPVVIQRIGIDPAVASGPFITTLTDNTSMLVYYGVAALILRGAGL